MYCSTQKFREKMNAGQLCLGPGITFADPAVTESIAPLAGKSRPSASSIGRAGFKPPSYQVNSSGGRSPQAGNA